MTPVRRIAALPWARHAAALDEDGFAVTPPVLEQSECAALSALFDDGDTAFRSTVDMARHAFGRGTYRYFDNPLPPLVAALRAAFYGPLAPIANAWADRLGSDERWPQDLEALQARCRAAGQRRPTPLLLRYGAGDYNCLHQDRYGAVQFPLQAVLQLDRPGIDFEGGELVLVEQRPRQQSRASVVPLPQGCAALFPGDVRPRAGVRGVHRVRMRHGVSRIHSGCRTTLGLIFHDAQ